MIKLSTIKANNGVTLNANGEAVNYSKGYQISKQDLYIIPVYRLRKYLIQYTLKQLKQGEHLGVWIDKNKAYIDISTHIYGLERSIELGRKRKQISIWDWQNNTAVYC